MKKTLGVIGTGNMGGAIVKGLMAHDVARLVAHNRTKAKVDALSGPDDATPLGWAASPEALAAESDIILLAVKPVQVASLLEKIKPELGEGKIIVSIAAAVSMEKLAAWSDNRCPVVRSMPNLPVVVGKGVFALCFDDARLGEQDRELLRRMFSLLGLVTVLPESQLAAFSAVAGCGPAYACLLMEGMQNAAVTMGLTAAQAKELVAATVAGTADMAAASGESFADLRARVCSPAGMTIDAVNHLERTAVRGHVTDAVLAAWERDARMAGN